MAKKEQTKTKKEQVNKFGVWGRFMNYCHGVKTEFKRVRWTTKKELKTYSIATITFVLVFSLFFYGINALYALIHTLIG